MKQINNYIQEKLYIGKDYQMVLSDDPIEAISSILDKDEKIKGKYKIEDETDRYEGNVFNIKVRLSRSLTHDDWERGMKILRQNMKQDKKYSDINVTGLSVPKPGEIYIFKKK